MGLFDFTKRNTPDPFEEASRYAKLVDDWNTLVDKWDKLVRRVNAKGGEDFLNDGLLIDNASLDKLIRLCHPDKHNGSQTSTEITQWLNSVKQSRKG